MEKRENNKKNKIKQSKKKILMKGRQEGMKRREKAE